MQMQIGTNNWDVKNLQRRKTVEFFFSGQHAGAQRKPKPFFVKWN